MDKVILEVRLQQSDWRAFNLFCEILEHHSTNKSKCIKSKVENSYKITNIKRWSSLR